MNISGQRKRKIVLAAIVEFGKKGFEKASMDAVAVRAKVAKGTVFYHFKSKTELFEEIVAEGQRSLEKRIVLEINSVVTNREKIEKIIEIEVDFIKKYHNLFLVYFGGVVKKPISSEVINSVLKKGIEAGEFRRIMDIETAAMSMFWMTAMVSLNLKGVETKEIQRMVLDGITA